MYLVYSNRAGASLSWNQADIPGLLAKLYTSIRQIRQDLPEITALAEKVAEHHTLEFPALDEIWTLAAHLQSRLLIHLDKEENMIYPRIERNYNALDYAESFSLESLTTCLDFCQHEHSEISDSLSAIRNTTDGFKLPMGACSSWREMYRRLENLEIELRRNFELEEKVLLPLAIQHENERNRASRMASGRS